MNARNTDPDTSHEAAGLINAAAIRERMLAVIRAAGPVGAIWDDLRAALPGVAETSISPRIKELQSAGLIVRLGDKRRGASGFNQLVCRIK